MTINDPVKEAKAIVALAFRNGPIEDLHTGIPCPTCAGLRGYSKISDAEMKRIMNGAMNHLCALLRLKLLDPEGYGRQIDHGAASWDEPE